MRDPRLSGRDLLHVARIFSGNGDVDHAQQLLRQAAASGDPDTAAIAEQQLARIRRGDYSPPGDDGSTGPA